MERISAACAMDWSIELDKGLRSKLPGQSVRAILQIGPRLEQWNREPELSLAEYKFFGLVPGEDRMFANAILLRLADAFSSGDKHTKLSVVRIFLSELRHRRKTSERNCNKIWSKRVVGNYLELLRRVKFVFDTGDVESRALALYLFGCWAPFAKDSAEIRYVILSSLVSGHALEVKASLFAAGCFCELSDDFASVLLEMLINILISSETLPGVRLAGVLAFSKIGCSSSVATSAYKAGLNLVLYSSEEDFLVPMLISLSKIVSKSTLLISKQVDMLFSFLSQEKSLRLQATSLKCLHFILVRGSCHFTDSANYINLLFDMLTDCKFPPGLQSGALQILHKILLYNLPIMPCVEMLEFPKLLTIVENASESPLIASRLLANRVLVDISGRLMERKEMVLDGVVSNPLASRVLSFVIDRITFLVKPVLDCHQCDTEMDREIESLLRLFLLLVEEHPDLGGLLLDKICLFIEYLVNINDGIIGMGLTESSGHEIVEFGKENRKFIISKLLLHISIVVVACLDNINENGVFTKVLSIVNLLVKHVHPCSLFDCYTQTVYPLLMHSHITCYEIATNNLFACMSDEIVEGDNLDRNLFKSLHDYSVRHEVLTLDCAKQMLTGNDNWSAYKAAKFAACQGAWFTAAFIFGHLTTRVQSNSCYCWLKSLSQFAYSERRVQLLIFPKQGPILVDWLETNKNFILPFEDDLGETGRGTGWKMNSLNFTEHIIKVCDSIDDLGETGRGTGWKINSLHFTEHLIKASDGIQLSEETLGGTIPSGSSCFQRWFLALRARVLRSVVDILKLLGDIPFTQENISDNIQVEGSAITESPRLLQMVTFLVHSLTQISLRLKRLAKEFDLIATTFIGMDNRSLKVISALALGCSLLAFSTGFALLIPNLHSENLKVCSLENSEDCLHAPLIQDLLQRLSQRDYETSTKLGLLLKVYGHPRSCFLPQSKNQILAGYEGRSILTICSYAVTKILDLQNEANGANNDEILFRVTCNGLQLLLDVVTKWTQIPFRTPYHFFRIRPCISSELFALSGDDKSSDGISVMPGFHLSLNLCLQLKNVPAGLPVRLTKLYCILSCRPSFRMTCQNEQKGLGIEDSGADDMVDLNEKLSKYVTGYKRTTSRAVNRDNSGHGGIVYAFVCFEPNERGQGFSTCLLDVSSFPVGSYRIKWHSCCIDNKGSYWSLLPSNAGPVFTVK